MSSSSSLAAARRRRVGGQSQPQQTQQQTQQQQTQQRQTQPPIPPNGGNGVPSPFVLLQQHNVKIKLMEEMIQELTKNQSTSPNIVGGETQNQHLDINALSDKVMARIESTMDLKAFYDNDQRLSSEIELLQKSNESQQITINSLNSTLHYIIQNLNLSNSLSVVNSDINSLNNDNYINETGRIVYGDNDENKIPAFPDGGKSVIINEVKNEIREFSQMDEDEEGSNYTELENPAVD